ncbi:TPA: hypothetical protein ACFM0I_001970, partial [Neisseria meningitidis]
MSVCGSKSKGRILAELYAAPVSDGARCFVIMRRRMPFQTAFFCIFLFGRPMNEFSLAPIVVVLLVSVI